MLTVTKLDNVWMQIYSDNEGVYYELLDYFSFRVPGYQHMPLYKNGVWDGRIKLFNGKNRLLYVGLLTHLEKFAKQFDYDLNIDPKLYTKENVPAEEIKEFSKTLNITKKDKPLKPRYYQMVGLYYMINAKRTVLVSPTASGKSLMCYMFARWILDNENPDAKILIVVPTTNLVEQMGSDFLDYSNGGFDNFHQIYEGKEKINTNKNIYISTWQSIYDLPGDYFDAFNSVIVDECHGAQASSLKRILETCQAEYRVGMTGTMHDPEAHKWVIEGLLGPTIDLISLKELEERKWRPKLKINCVVFKHKDPPGSLSYHDEITYLIEHQERNKTIMDLMGKQTQNTFVLFDKVKYGEMLYEKLQELFPNKKIELVYGATKVDEREKLRKALEKEDGATIVASYRVFSTGVSIDNLHILGFAEPVGKSIFRILQSIGRALRLHDSKDEAVLWDFTDKLSGNNHTFKHFMQRIELYNKHNLKYKIVNVDID